MRQTAIGPAMTEDEYVQYELKAERRHEYINGQLFEMPGEKDINNEMAFLIAMLLHNQLPKDWRHYNHDVKVAIPDSLKYYYPDVFVTAEPKTEANKYIKREPLLIVEVVSEGSQTQNYVNKYLDYIQIPSFKYYIIAEPETVLINAYEREGEGWIARKYTRMEDIIQLPELDLALPLSEIYQ